MTHLNFTTIGLSGLTAKADVDSIKSARYIMQVKLCAFYSKLLEIAQAVGSAKSPCEWLSDQRNLSHVFTGK